MITDRLYLNDLRTLIIKIISNDINPTRPTQVSSSAIDE